jgi:nucleolar protein 53
MFKVRKALPKINPKLLTSTRILSQRSAVPAVASRATATQKRKLSYADKERLLRVGKRARRGPLDSYQDETEFGKGSALLELSEAAKRSGEYNVWEEEEEEELPEGAAKRKPKVASVRALPGTRLIWVQAPKHVDPRDAIALAAISDPHQGTSYNPAVDAHTALLDAARIAEEQRLADTQRFAGIKEKFASASAPPHAPDVPPGMVVAAGDGADEEDDEEPEGWAGVRAPRAVPKPKTKQQRARKLKLLEEVMLFVLTTLLSLLTTASETRSGAEDRE